MPAGEATLAAELVPSEVEYGDSGGGIIEQGDAAELDHAANEVVGDERTNEWVVMSALERVVPWTTSEPALEKSAPVLIIDDDLVPDTLTELSVATRFASS